MQHFRHIMLCYFEKGKNAAEVQKKIYAVYGDGAMTDRMCQKWFAKFRARLLHAQVEVDSDQIKTLRTIDIVPRGRQLKISKTIKLLVKMKNVSILQKKLMDFLAISVYKYYLLGSLMGGNFSFLNLELILLKYLLS